MPRHRGKSKKACGKGAVWGARRPKPVNVKMVDEIRTHTVPCGNYACEPCRPELIRSAKWRKVEV